MALVFGVMPSPNSGGVEAVSIGVNVGEDGDGSGEQDGGGRAVPGVGGHDDLVAEADAGGLQGHHQGYGAVGEGAAVTGAVVGCELLREFGGETVGEGEAAPVAALQDLKQALLVAIGIEGPGMESLASYPASAKNCELTHVPDILLDGVRDGRASRGGMGGPGGGADRD